MSGEIFKLGLGWLPDYPDFRDYTSGEGHIKAMLATVGVEKPLKVGFPVSVDLRAWCSPIENQGSLGSCTANAGVGMVEYFERRAFGKHVDRSRLFLYKATRNLLRWTGDTGAFLRTTMGALVLFGIPPEEYWPYVVADYEKEPTAFCYAYAQNYQTISYYRLDPPGTAKGDPCLDLQSTVLFHRQIPPEKFPIRLRERKLSGGMQLWSWVMMRT